MTKAEIKNEIQKVLDQVPEEVLVEVLDFLQLIQSAGPGKIGQAENLRQILKEDKNLLERLAQ